MSDKKNPSNQQNKANQRQPETKKPDVKATAETKKPEVNTTQGNKPTTSGTAQANKADNKPQTGLNKGADPKVAPSQKPAAQTPKPDPKVTSSKPAATQTPNKAQSAQKSPATSTDSMSSKANTPPPASRTNHKANSGSGKGNILPLVISLVALGVGGYGVYLGMNQPADPNIAELKQSVQSLNEAQSQQVSADEIESLKKDIQQIQEQQVSDQQIQSLIDQSIKSAGDEQQKAFSAQLAEQSAAASQPTGLSKQDVQTMIKSALSSAGGDAPKVDLSEEMAQIESYKQEIAQLAEQTQNTIGSQLKQAQTQISENKAQPLVYPLINNLSLANIASDSRQYDTAARYLQQAEESFSSLHLDQPPYANFAGKISEMAAQYDQLAASENPSTKVAGLIAGIDEWPFKTPESENLLASNEQAATDDWSAKLKSVGNDILTSTVSITNNDAAGLDWVSKNPALQQIVRENVRLDLSMARNLLATGEFDAYQSLAETLSTQIERYFDTNNEAVSGALQTLSDAGQAQASETPDIASLISELQQAK
ncbi:uroporphyrinogen-III C-methyltransferase [Suttonella sp. R2A3]|uniref:uroporphyrinogen-III C-methyltransferase n=1 Tax=Suttonella sp. R2A3 TaxID=2908648 RepID=UPI001F3FACD0|nr:uroporphyrinogen-III C-methyltransferase [Suttonella sp. R2A3]UJF25091.1 uroporphyrinogen-III C-methyltransferase [Suttonella sp. R2A3]